MTFAPAGNSRQALRAKLADLFGQGLRSSPKTLDGVWLALLGWERGELRVGSRNRWIALPTEQSPTATLRSETPADRKATAPANPDT